MGAKRKYVVNDHFFQVIDSPEKAYIFGFICGDGSNDSKRRTMEICLNVRDAPLLQRINDFIQPTRPLNFCDRGSKGAFCRMRVCSQSISDDLTKWGCVPRKTLVITWPEWLDQALWSSFLRGMWDSDGTIGLDSAELMTTTSCAIRIKEILKSLLGVNFTLYQVKRKDGSLSGVTKMGIGGRNVTRKFLNWLYEDSNPIIRLERKYLKYIAIRDYVKPQPHNKSRKENGEYLTKEERAQQRREIEKQRYYDNKSPDTRFVPKLIHEDGSPFTLEEKRIRLRRKDKERRLRVKAARQIILQT